jgi:Dolichyl-phosphate-mannose-protein mannosyltransferase
MEWSAFSRNKYVNVLICILALLSCVLVARPFVSMGAIDDWSYIWTARVLADTGRLTYNGWGAMPLGWVAYLGALFIKLFGFSFTIVRLPILVISLLTAALMQRVFVRCGTSEPVATVATLTLVLSPLFLPSVPIFTSDIAGLFVVMLCIYACIRSYQSTSDKAALGWLIFAALSNIVGGTVRQIAWLGVFLIVPSAAWFMRRRRHMLLVGAILWCIAVLSAALYLRWFKAQPYVMVDKVFYPYHLNSIFGVARTTMVPWACLLPILSIFLVRSPAGLRSARNIAAVAGVVVAILLFWWAMKSPHGYFRISPFGVDGSNVPFYGMGEYEIIGHPPYSVPLIVRFLLIISIFAATASFFACLIGSRSRLAAADSRSASEQSSYPYVPNAYLLTLFAAFAMATFFLSVTRSMVWDRYFLPLQFIVTLGIIRVYRQTISERLPWLCLAIGFVFTAYSVAAMHDFFSYQRARLDAINEIRAAGIPRLDIEGGHEYDSWTQLEQTGYVNEPRIQIPAGAYREWTPPYDTPPECIGYTRRFAPSLHPLLHLSNDPNGCFAPSKFPPVAYKAWLSPRQRTIYVLEGR